MTKQKKSISDELNKLEKIVEWFEGRDEVDVEAGLIKVKEGARLIKDLKNKLKTAENEFEEIKKDLIESED